MNKEIEIVGNPSKTSNICFFTASIPILENFRSECHSKEEARNSPLFEGLFDFPWVLNVAAEGNTLVVKKNDEAPWQAYAKTVGQLIRKLHDGNVPFFNEVFLESFREDKKNISSEVALPYKVNTLNINTPLGLRIQKILSEVVGPSLAAHGGHVNLVDVDSGKVFLYFGGGCQGCSQATVTVKQGIEKLLLKEFPELTCVLDITNHSVGINPYFK
jgi:Fe-S cluster biogenesis protein NfuA